MTAKNIQTRNLTTSITKTLNNEVRAQRERAHAYRDDLKSKRITADFIREKTQHDQFTAKLQRQATRAANNVNAMQKRYDDMLADRLTMKGDTATEALLAETRATKTWQRLERDLTGKNNAAQLNILQQRLDTAIKNGDHATVAAINSEAPHYFNSIGVDDSAHIIEVIIRNGDTELRDAYADITEAKKLHAVTNHNVSMITRDIEQDISRGLDAPNEDIDNMRYYVDPTQAVRNDTHEKNDELRAIIDAAMQTDQEKSTDINDPEAPADADAPDWSDPNYSTEPAATEDTEPQERFSNNDTITLGPNESITN